jgi:hypothetical protein
MGKRLHMAATGEFILWAVIPEGPKSSFNRAYGPFASRSAAYSAKTALTNNKRAAMVEEGYSPEEIKATIDGIEWSTTGLWRKVEDDRLIDPVAIAPDTVEERAAEAIWNRSSPVAKGARPKWTDVRNDPAWKRGVADTRADAKAAIAAVSEPAEDSADAATAPELSAEDSI